MASLDTRITRRRLLAFSALVAATAITACGGSSSSTATTAPAAGNATAAPKPTTAVAATTAPAAATSAPAATTAPAASAPSTTGGASPAATAAKITTQGNLKFMRGSGNDAFWDKMYAGFKAKTGVTVESVINTGTVEDGTVPTALKSGSGPDVVNINSGPARIGFLAQAGLIKQLDDSYAKFNWTDRLVPFAIDRLKNQGKIFQGKFWEIPNSVDVIYWDYNKDVYQKVGIKPPDTFDEMVANFDKLKAGGVTAVNLGVRSSFAGGWLFGNLIQAAAGTNAVKDVLFADGKWDQPEFVHAAQILQDWVKKGYISPASTTLMDSEVVPIFENKQAGTYCVGTWLIPTMTGDKVDITNVDAFVMPTIAPTGSKLPTGGFGNSFIVAANTKNPDAALAWMDYLVSEDYVQALMDNPANGTIPAAKVPASAKPKTALLQKAVDILAKDGTGYNPSVHVVAAITTAYYDALQGILGGLTAPDKAMANVQAAKVKAAS